MKRMGIGLCFFVLLSFAIETLGRYADESDSRAMPKTMCGGHNVRIHLATGDKRVQRFAYSMQDGVRDLRTLANLTTGFDARSVAFDQVHNETLYASANGKIHALREGIEDHVVVANPSGKAFQEIVVDPVTDNLYYVADKGQRIGVCHGHDPKSSVCVTLVETPKNNNDLSFFNLVLLPTQGRMFWLQLSDYSRNSIMTASMNGDHVRKITTFDAYPLALAMDAVNQVLYVATSELLMTLDVETYAVEKFLNISGITSMAHDGCNLFYVTHNTTTHSFKNGRSYYSYTYSYTHSYRLNALLKSAYFGKDTYDDKLIHEWNMTSADYAVEKPSFTVANDIKLNIANPCEALKCTGVCVLTERRHFESAPTGKCVEPAPASTTTTTTPTPPRRPYYAPQKEEKSAERVSTPAHSWATTILLALLLIMLLVGSMIACCCIWPKYRGLLERIATGLAAAKPNANGYGPVKQQSTSATDNL